MYKCSKIEKENARAMAGVLSVMNEFLDSIDVLIKHNEKLFRLRSVQKVLDFAGPCVFQRGCLAMKYRTVQDLYSKNSLTLSIHDLLCGLCLAPPAWVS